jgi:precorrin-6B methylase 2
MMRAPDFLLALLLAFLLFVTSVNAADLQPSKDAGPYVPSPQSVVADMLRYAEVGPNDFLIDLGSGDGRIVLTAAKVFGARGFGVEIKDELVRRSNEAAQKEGLADRVKFLKQDLFKTDMSQASVITMYLLPDTVNLLKDKFLSELRPGTRIVSHDYPLTGWIPEKYVQMDLEDKVQISGVTTTLIYLYMVPAKVAGRWSAQMPPAVSKQPATLQLKQQLTRVSGSARVDGKDVPLEDLKLRGDRISFRLSGRKGEFTGQVKGNSIEGMVENGASKAPWSATLGG